MGRGASQNTVTDLSLRDLILRKARERTGDAFIDSILEEFLSLEGEMQSDHLRVDDLGDMRDGMSAAGMCDVMAVDFAAYCQQMHGVEVFLSEQYFEQPHAYNNNPGWLMHPEQLGYSPEEIRFLYQPEDEESYYNSLNHCANILEGSDGSVFLIDWTASQFGRREFPFVQKLEDGRWVRDWA
jgi:hypothetical protein